jgi:hypothetical protein
VSLRPLVEDGGARLELLLAHLQAQAGRGFRVSKVHPAEMPNDVLESIGFRATGRHRLYTATARSD